MSDFNQFFMAATPSFPNAACADTTNPDLFFPDTKDELNKVLPTVRETCGSCVHQLECLKFALDEGIEHGIWGGMTPAERKRIQPRRKRAYTNDLGERVDRLRAEGLRFNEISERLGVSVSACQQAHYRLKLRRAEA